MSPIEIAWSIVGIIVSVAITLGYTFVGLTPPDFARARFCFISAAIALGGMEMVWYTQSSYSFAWRVSIASLICLTIGIGLPETLRWAHRRETQAGNPPRSNGNTPLPAASETAEATKLELTQIDKDTTVLYENKKVFIYNKGQQNFYLWGSVYGNIAPVVDEKPRVLAPGNYYYLFAEGLERQFIEDINKRHATDGATPYFVFIATESGNKYTLNWLLLGKLNPQGGLTIHTQNLGTEGGWKSGDYSGILAKAPVQPPPTLPGSSEPQTTKAPERKKKSNPALQSVPMTTVPTGQTISAPNGIAIGGGNVTNPTVNNFAPPERHLTTSQIQALSALAASLPDDTSKWFFVETINAPESLNVADEIEMVFRTHNKTTGVVTRLFENPPIPRGVFVIVSSKDSEHFDVAQKIANILGSSTFIVRFETATGLTPQQVKVVVELN